MSGQIVLERFTEGQQRFLLTGRSLLQNSHLILVMRVLIILTLAVNYCWTSPRKGASDSCLLKGIIWEHEVGGSGLLIPTRDSEVEGQRS